MTTKTETYVLGMKAINHFYSMLFVALQESMPEALISSSGAYVWRGFRIDKYKDLASGQYYCQVWPHDAKTLVFQEGYKDSERKPSQFEIDNQIQQGRYYYPFTEALDLVHTRFFDFDRGDQFLFLQKFITNSAAKALLWQEAETRKNVTGKKFLHGKLPRFIPVRIPTSYEQVGIEFLQAWKDQTQVLMKIKELLEIIYKNCEWVRPNASIHNFGFRGMRMKLPGIRETSRWDIYFNDFERVKFRIPNSRKNSFDLVGTGFFDLPLTEQTEQLEQFIHANMDKNH